MEIIISGYGETPNETLVEYFIEQSEDPRMKWAASLENPSFVCEGGGYLFTVTEADNYAYIYILQRMEKGYQILDQKRIEGGALCHIVYSKINKALFGACYATGTLFSIRVEDNKFGELLHHEVQTTEDPSALTRAHCVLLNQDETQLLVINIALDMIFFYQIENGKLQLAYTLDTPKESGPRHAIYSKDETLLYVITEYSNEILVYENRGRRVLLQRISTLASTFNAPSNCSTLCFGKDGTYLYVANRGADTIAVLSVNEDGTLVWLKEYNCGGKHPRHMIITKDGRYLIVCNQNSDNVVIFELDLNTGALQSVIRNISFKTPSGVLQID